MYVHPQCSIRPTCGDVESRRQQRSNEVTASGKLDAPALVVTVLRRRLLASEGTFLGDDAAVSRDGRGDGGGCGVLCRFLLSIWKS